MGCAWGQVFGGYGIFLNESWPTAAAQGGSEQEVLRLLKQRWERMTGKASSFSKTFKAQIGPNLAFRTFEMLLEAPRSCSTRAESRRLRRRQLESLRRFRSRTRDRMRKKAPQRLGGISKYQSEAVVTLRRQAS